MALQQYILDAQVKRKGTEKQVLGMGFGRDGRRNTQLHLLVFIVKARTQDMEDKIAWLDSKGLLLLRE
jgi:hypothetical protein